MEGSQANAAVRGCRITIRGVVQGVGFRPWVYTLAVAYGVAGGVRNDAHGVTIEAFGPPGALDAFVHALGSPPEPARIDHLTCEAIPPKVVRGFAIAPSAAAGDRAVSIPPDLATCGACVAETQDPGNRRHRYAFTNCTHCGPRFTIARDIPYDRQATTMARFAMCSACQREYDDVNDRRFHAQPNACPACGPQLRIVRPDGELIAGDPIEIAAAALRDGKIVAVKGLGGFHLACDATSPTAVRRLRERKRRDEKPLAVMVRDLESAAAVADLDATEAALLTGPEHPIVLARHRVESGLAPDCAPENPLVGVVLPYTPLHHLLMAALQCPLVMTSGNLSEEPIVAGNDEAQARLANLADCFLLHDRPIATRCDDSVVRVIGGAPTVLRRARGYVPRGVGVAAGFEQPVLACGAQLKNTFCIGIGQAAYLGPHIGDLDSVATADAFRRAVRRMQRFLDVVPAVVAHDLHPDYLSTAYARERAGATLVGVQHHHAHVVSAIAEHDLGGPVIGVAFDGTGHGTDGTMWGGEFLVATPASFERVATFRPLALAGGDVAIRQVWRQAAAFLDDAFDGEAPLSRLPLFADLPPVHLRVVRQMIHKGVNAPLAHGVGRYFDAVGALVLRQAAARYEAQVAMACEFAATGEAPPYPYAVDVTTLPWTVDLRPMGRALVDDLLAGQPGGGVAARFHATVVAATMDVVARIGERYGRLPVVLAGGCFQNRRLAEPLLAGLGARGRVYMPRAVPPGDGGLALGQAVVADAVMRAG